MTMGSYEDEIEEEGKHNFAFPFLFLICLRNIDHNYEKKVVKSSRYIKTRIQEDRDDDDDEMEDTTSIISRYKPSQNIRNWLQIHKYIQIKF